MAASKPVISTRCCSADGSARPSTGCHKLIEQANRLLLCWPHQKPLRWLSCITNARGFFPENAVEYFVSYLRLLPARSGRPSADIYIDKEATNTELDKLRMSANAFPFRNGRDGRDRGFRLLASRVGSSPEAYYGMLVLSKRSADLAEALLRRPGWTFIRTLR